MASKKDKPKKEKKEKVKKEKVKKEKGPKKALVFDPSDGVTWHDFVGLLLMFIKFLFRIVRLVFAPVFWIYAENVRMVRFVRAKGEDRTMTTYEREFVESIPVIFSLTGLIGGILVGFMIIFQFGDFIEAFIESLDTDWIVAIGNIILAIAGAVWWVISGLAVGIYTLIENLAKLIIDAFELNAFVAFTLLAVIGIVAVLIWILMSEKGVFSRITKFIRKVLKWIAESPDKFRFNLQNYYRRFNHWWATKLIGEERLATRTQVYFKKTVFYTLLTSLWSFGSGIYVGFDIHNNPKEGSTVLYEISFTAFVLFIAGIISGFLFLMFIGRFLDALNRKTYMSPEFILEDGSFDDDAVKGETQKLHDDKPWLKEYVSKDRDELKEDEERPWKKKKADKKEEEKSDEESSE